MRAFVVAVAMLACCSMAACGSSNQRNGTRTFKGSIVVKKF
jgi:hypothetical protein